MPNSDPDGRCSWGTRCTKGQSKSLKVTPVQSGRPFEAKSWFERGLFVDLGISLGFGGRKKGAKTQKWGAHADIKISPRSSSASWLMRMLQKKRIWNERALCHHSLPEVQVCKAQHTLPLGRQLHVESLLSRGVGPDRRQILFGKKRRKRTGRNALTVILWTPLNTWSGDIVARHSGWAQYEIKFCLNQRPEWGHMMFIDKQKKWHIHERARLRSALLINPGDGRVVG